MMSKRINKVMEKKKIKKTFTNIIHDSFSETNKYIPETNNYFSFLTVEILNNFFIKKINKENIQNLILSLITRLIFSQIYHLLLITYKDEINNFIQNIT